MAAVLFDDVTFGVLNVYKGLFWYVKINILNVIYSFLPLNSREVTMESSKPNSNAHQKPSICIPFTIFDASSTISAVITNKNNPRVIMVKGIVRITSNGRINTFTNASTKEKTIAVQ